MTKPPLAFWLIALVCRAGDHWRNVWGAYKGSGSSNRTSKNLKERMTLGGITVESHEAKALTNCAVTINSGRQ
jgi:hypothetical protein